MKGCMRYWTAKKKLGTKKRPRIEAPGCCCHHLSPQEEHLFILLRLEDEL